MATLPASPVVSKPNGQVAPKQPSYAELVAKVKELEAAAAQAKKPQAVTVRIMDDEAKGQKGTIAVFGLGRFPTALYASQWERMLTQETVGEILRLCKDPRASRKS